MSFLFAAELARWLWRRTCSEVAMVVLLAEDNQDHAELVIRGLEASGSNEVHWVLDGEALLDYLNGRGDYLDPSTCPLPELILLDLRLPKVDGFEALREIKSSVRLRVIPVVVLTSSDADSDVRQAYDEFVNSYLVKPAEFEDWIATLNDVRVYWLERNRTVTP